MAIVPDLSGNSPFLDNSTATIEGIKRSYDANLSDTDNLTHGNAAAILVGAAGDVKMTYPSGIVDTVYYTAGVWHPVDVARVWSTGTDATGIKVGYV